MLVVVDRDVDVVERVDERVRWCAGRAEVRIQDGSDFGTDQPLIFLNTGAAPAVELVIRVRLAVAWQRRMRSFPMQPQGVFEQADPGSERHRLGRHAHRRTEDSILSITRQIIPAAGGRDNHPGPNEAHDTMTSRRTAVAGTARHRRGELPARTVEVNLDQGSRRARFGPRPVRT